MIYKPMGIAFFMGKKCPVCNSSRYQLVEKGMIGARCGYTHKSVEVVNEELSRA